MKSSKIVRKLNKIWGMAPDVSEEMMITPVLVVGDKGLPKNCPDPKPGQFFVYRDNNVVGFFYSVGKNVNDEVAQSYCEEWLFDRVIITEVIDDNFVTRCYEVK